VRILRLALAQINLTVGDLEGNFRKIADNLQKAEKLGVDLIAFPEMTITGYPPEDLLLKPEFIDDNLDYLHKLLPYTENLTAIVGFVERKDDIFNAAAILHQEQIVGVYRKLYLPNYGVFDEDRYFQAGTELLTFTLSGVTFGVNICEDIWYPEGPSHDQALYGNAEVIINISASPYVIGKSRARYRMLSVRAEDNDVIVAFCNLVGGQDELIFDGSSMVISEEGEMVGKCPAFEEDLLIVDLHPDNVFNKRLHDPRRRKEKILTPPDRTLRQIELPPHKERSPMPSITTRKADFLEKEEEVYKALTLGLRDYVHKNRFEKVVLGISGGIDSALVATIAVDALGAENVIGLILPSEFTSPRSLTDARKLVENLKITSYEISITKLYHTYLSELEPYFKEYKKDITEENIQARIRGNLLMAFSNKFGWLVLATGNKSELSVGYCTLYGDMVGGFAVIKDVPKTMVYDLCKYRNRKAGRELIPKSILTKAPSAELRPNQKDTDTLPPYEVLDPIVRAYVEKDLSFEEIVSKGFDEETVKRVIHLIDGNEYKRRQAPPGIKITHRAFGKDRRFPITNGYNPNS